MDLEARSRRRDRKSEPHPARSPTTGGRLSCVKRGRNGPIFYRNFYRNFYRAGRNRVAAVSTLQDCSLHQTS